MVNNFSEDLALMIDDVSAAYRRAQFKTWTLAHQYSSERFRTMVDADTVDGALVERIQIDDDSLFICAGINMSARDNDHQLDLSAFIGALLTIRLESSGYYIAGPVPQPFATCTGTGEALHLFGYPLVLPPGERLRFNQWFNEDQTDSVIITLAGAKMYTRPYTRSIVLPDH